MITQTSMSFSNGYGLVMFKVAQKLKKSFKYSIKKNYKFKRQH